MPDWIVHRAVRLDDEQAVEADRAGRRSVLTATPTPRTFEPTRLPLRAFRSSQLNSSAPLSSASFTNALVHVAALAARVGRTERRLAFRRVDPVDRDLIDAELARRLRRGSAPSA